MMGPVVIHASLFCNCPLPSKVQAANAKIKISPRKKAHHFVLKFLDFGLLVRNKHSH